jgi:hypothetical protein
MPPAGDQRTVVTVLGDHGLKTDLRALASAVDAWLARALERIAGR